MADLSNAALSPLGGVRLDIGGVTIAEITDRSIVSVAIPNDGEAALAKKMAAAFKCKIPKVGASSSSVAANSRFLGLQSDQFFAVFDRNGPDPVKEVEKHLKSVAYLTDQSDGWVIIRVSGEACRAVLERICPLDLHKSIFLDGTVARTAMEHLNVIIFRQGRDDFLLLSPRSSSKSFLHALELSARNVT